MEILRREHVDDLHRLAGISAESADARNALVFGELQLAAAVTLALAGASVVTSALGLVLAWLLARTGSDPAYRIGPLASIVQDVLGLLIFFGCLSAIVL